MLWSENTCNLQSCLCYCFALRLSNSSRLQFLMLSLQHPSCSRLGLSYGSVNAASLKQETLTRVFQTRAVLQLSYVSATVCDRSGVTIPLLSWRRQTGLVLMRWVNPCGSETEAIKLISKHATWHRTNPRPSSSRVNTNTLAILFPFTASLCRFVQTSPILICFSFCTSVQNREIWHFS